MSAPPNASTTTTAAAAARPDRVDSPLGLRHIPISFDPSDAEKSALQLVGAYDPAWTTEDGPVEFVRFTDGITNTLMKAVKKRPGWTELQIDQNAILMRAYGQGTDVLIDRERELRAHSLLANLGLAPRLLARFDNGLMYKFIPGHVCSHTDLSRPATYRQVAKRMGQWHSLPISAIATTPVLAAEPPTQKHPAPGQRQRHRTRPHPNTWTVMRQWIDALPRASEGERARVSVLEAELEWLGATLGDTKGLDGRDFVFAHHDLLCGNVIVDVHAEQEEKPVHFIDYEYATPGPAAFDIANHFAEWAGYDCAHDAVPTRSQRTDFLAHYVASYRRHSDSLSDRDPRALDPDLVRRDVDTLNAQVDLWRGVPGFYWGIWALIQAAISHIDFDYVKYSEGRLKEYWSWKEEVTGSRAREGREMYVRERRWQSE